MPGTTLVALTARPDEDLAGALAHYTAVGIQTYVFFADPLSFQPDGVSPKAAAEERQQQFLSSLLGAQAAVLILRRNEARHIEPEPISDAIYHT
jgi:hypothetical protein